MLKNRISEISILSAGILWGIISIFVSGLNSLGFSSLETVALRCFFTVVLLFVRAVIEEKSLVKPFKSGHSLNIKLRDLPYFVGMGVLSIVFFNFCYFRAIEIIGSAAVPALLLYTAPIFVMVMSAIFFKEKITAKKLVALVLCFAGLLLVTGVFGTSDALSLEAFLFGIGSGFGYALYSIFGKKVTSKYTPFAISFYTFVFASLVSVPLSGIASKLPSVFEWKALLYSLGIALISTVLPYIFYNYGLKNTEAGKASILATAEPVVAALVGLTFFGESFSLAKTVGMLIIISAILLLNVNLKRKSPEQTSSL